MDDKEMRSHLLRDVVFLLPLFILMAVGYVPMTVDAMNLWLSFFIVTLAIAIPFTIDIFFLTRGKHFLPDAKKRGTQGVVYVWVVAAITLGIVAMVWWVVSYPLFMIIDAYAQIFTTPPEVAPLLSLITRVIVWFLGIVVAGVIIWALVSSYQGERQTYPMGGPYFG